MEETRTLLIHTLSFGEIEIPENRILFFREGLPGFPNHHRFVVLSFDDLKPFEYLQALDEPPLAFLVINPFLVLAGYRMSLSDPDLADLASTDPADLTVYAVANVPEDPSKATVNLFAPIVVNEKGGKGRQFLLHDSGYSVKHPLLKLAEGSGG
jgi:flagellar assembly factor FliW